MEASEIGPPAGGAIAETPDYARELQRGTAWLRFAPSAESEFRRTHLLRMRTQARFWQLLQLIAGQVGLYVVLSGPARAGTRMMLLACISAHLAVSAVLVIVAFSRAYTKSYYPLATILTPFRAASTAVIVASIVAAGGSGTAVMTINLFGLMFFSGLLLREAMPAALVMTASFLVALTGFDVQAGVAAYAMTSQLLLLGLAGFVA